MTTEVTQLNFLADKKYNVFMNQQQIARTTTIVFTLIGVGMVLGHNLSTGDSTTALWVGGLMILAAAVTLGMSLATRNPTNKEDSKDQ